MDFDQYNSSMEVIGSRKKPVMTGSDISAYLIHMAQRFHQSSGGGSMVSRTAPTKDSMKALIIANKEAAKVDGIPAAPSKPVFKKSNLTTKAAAQSANAASTNTSNNTSNQTSNAASTTGNTGKSGELKKEEEDMPDLKEIARLNQMKDEQLLQLEKMNEQLSNREACSEEDLKGMGNFDWNAKELHGVKLKENPASWGFSK